MLRALADFMSFPKLAKTDKAFWGTNALVDKLGRILSGVKNDKVKT